MPTIRSKTLNKTHDAKTRTNNHTILRGERMRYLMLVISLCSLSLFADQAYEPLLTRERFGGHVAPEWAGWKEQIVIYKNGNVVERYLANETAEWQETVVSTLSGEVINGITARLNGLRNTELSFPDNPICYDLPSTTYKAVNELNEEVQFAFDYQCRLGTPPNFSDAELLVAVLDGQALLASFNRHE